MTQKEFTERTKVEVSNEEFEIINEFYMNCECDKDEFCKMWCKMNPNRVYVAKEEMKRKAQEEAERDTLRKFYDKTGDPANWWTPIIYTRMTSREILAMTHTGITFENECGSGVKYLYDVRHEIGKHLGMY